MTIQTMFRGEKSIMSGVVGLDEEDIRNHTYFQ
jgi:hypothetical protein